MTHKQIESALDKMPGFQSESECYEIANRLMRKELARVSAERDFYKEQFHLMLEEIAQMTISLNKTISNVNNNCNAMGIDTVRTEGNAGLPGGTL